ncbi:MAG: hypothetical protein WC850_05685 [Candidatus Gracilibacteria bacterium]
MPLTYKQVQLILDDFDFKLSRSNGSHFRYEKEGFGLTFLFTKNLLQKLPKVYYLIYQKSDE